MKLRSLLLALFTVCLPGALSAAAITDLVGNAIATGTPTDRVPFTANSAGVYETFILTAVPGAPTSPVATRGNASASVAFTAPASNGGSAILSYTVTSSPGGLTGTGAASPISVSGLTNGTAYTFTVTATNAVGTGAVSVASAAVTPATVPGAPTLPVATRGNGSASVAFVAPASNGGSAITGYTVTSSPGGFTGTGTGTPIVVSGLTNGTAYTFTVTATNAVGPSAASAASAAVTPAAVPGAPTSPVATAGNASASVAFTAPASNGGSAITGYTVTSSPGGITATGSTSPINVTGLTNGTPYTFTVTATNVVGPSAASAASNSVTPAAAADITSSLSGGILTVTASVAASTTFRVVGGFLEIYDPTSTLGGGAGITIVDSHTVRIPLASIPNGLVINGSAAADTFTFDFTNPALALPGGITVNGGLPNVSPGDSIAVVNGNFGQVEYSTTGPGAGVVEADLTPIITFTGMEPLDFSSSTIASLIVDVDPTSSFAGNITTTVASADAGVNTLISFGSSGLESIKVGAVTGSISVIGDDLEQDYFILSSLGTAMLGDFSVDGKGGDSDVVEINNTTFTVAGAGKNFSAKADFIGLGRDATGINPGVLVCSGNITLEADGDGSLASVFLGAGGVWALPTTLDSTQALAVARGSIQVCGAITKSSGADATLTLKAKNGVFLTRAGTSTSGGTITSTSNKLHVVMNADSDNTLGGVVHCKHYSSVTSNGGDITLGGGATPATSPAIGNGAGSGASGIELAATTLTSGGGNISIRGQGATAGTSTIGALIAASTGTQDCTISSGVGSLTIVGNGGTAGIATGIQISGNTAGPLFTKILSTTGAISLTGVGGAVANAVGIASTNNLDIIGSGAANVSLSGTPTGTGLGISFGAAAGAAIRAQSAGGHVTFMGDRMSLNLSTGTKTISTTGSGIVTLKPLTAARLINLGSTLDNTANTLELSNAELANITAPTLTIGDGSNGAITVSAVISPVNYPTLALIGNTTFSATGGFTTDVTSASVFEKVTVTGTVNITAGAALTMASAGGYIWNGSDAFTILDNDAADAITGTFTGPTLTNFLGSALTVTQGYAAGTGNDLVFSAPPSANADLSALSTTATGMTPAFGAATLTYNATVLNATTTTTVTATRAQANATLQVQVNGGGFSPLTSGVASGPLSLNVGANPIQVRVTAQDGTTIQTYTITVTRAAPVTPDAPTSVTGTAGDASASVAFTAPAFDGGSAILSYTVTSSPGGFTGTGAASPISVSGLTNGTAYTFTVTATNAIGTGAASAPSTAVTPRTVPGAPSSPVATPGNASASVAFTAPASNGGAAITSYTVTSSPGGFTGTGAASPISVSGLTNGTAYTFTVTATNVAGPGAASVASAAVTPRTVPGFPTSPVATAGNASASVAFTAPASNGGSAILSYTVTSSPGGFTGTGAASPISVTGLTNGTAYTFTVTATNAAGTGAASPASAAVTPRTVPGAPTSPVATPGNASASVAFTAPASTGGSAILSYTVTSSPGGFTGTGAASPISVTGLTNGTSYTFTVTATNAAGTGAASVPSAAVTPATVPGAPTSPVATGGNASASVAFSAPASDGGSAITLYTVTSNPGSFTGTGTASPVTVTGLTNGTPYTFTVRATNIMGQGPASVASASVTPSVPAVMNNYVVTTIADSDPASWTALELSTGKINGTNTVSLRSAVLAANQSGVGPHTISVPAALGTYVLSQTNPTNAATFSTNGGIDLVVGSHGSAITIQGTGGKAIIQRGTGGGAGDVITTGLKSDGFTPAIVNLTLDSLDITGGTFTAVFTGADDGLGNVSRTTISNSTLRNNTNADAAFGQGGAVQNTNGFLTLNNTIFTSNTATNSGVGQGGAVYYSLPNASGQGSVGALSITGCTFTSNTSGLASGVGGGAIYAQVNSAGTATLITGCTFTSNSTTAGADGGAIVLDGSRAADVTNNDFVTNSVAGAGSGGALYVNNGAVNLNYNRFAGNTAATATNGGTLRRSASATGTVNANDNWWQSNLGPATNAVVGTVTQTSRINLKLVASPTALFSNATSTLTADFFTTSSASTLILPQVSTLIGRTVSFGSAVLGSLSGSQTSVQTAGTATSTFAAGLVSGTGSASVTIDGQTVSVNIAVTGVPAVTSSTSALAATATSVIITGSNFNTTPASNTVAFTGAFVGSGTVTAATTTQLTVSLSGQISGALNAVVTTGAGSSGSAVQVATVIPVVTSATASLAANATSMTINGFGFSSTALNNSVAFNNGTTGTVTGATSTSLTISSLSGLVSGSLTAVVTSNSASSGAAVQVATVTPVVTSSTTALFNNATAMTINGFGFSTTPGNNTVVFNNGTGTVTAATNTALTVTSLTGLVNGALNAVVTTSSQNSGTAVQVATVVPPAGFIVTPTSGLVTTEAGGTATFTVVLISQPSADVTVGLSSSNTAEGSVSPSSLTFTSLDWNVAKTVTVTGQNDLIVDGTVAYSIVTAAATSADLNYNTFNPADVSVSNTDNDSNTLAIDSPSVTEGNAGTSTLTFTVTSPTVVTGGFTVAYSTGAGTATVATDYLAASGTLTFAGTANETQTIAVTVNGDTLVEASETLTATLGAISAVTAPVLASQITSGAFGTGTITDNDAATVTIAKINDGAETPTSALFRVTQTAAASVDTVITYSTGGTASSTDFTAPTGSVTITAGNTTADITVTITNDALVEATETLSLTLTGFTARDPQVTLGTTVLATADITDNDSATVSIAKINDGAETNTPVAGLFRVTQTAASSTDTTLSYSVTGSAISGTDFTALSGSLTIAAGQTTADISVAILNDNIVEASETITVTLTAFTARDTDITLSAVPSATIAIVDVTDNDMATVSIAKINDGVEAALPTNALFRVTQSSASSTNTVIAYNVTGTATSGNDFTALSGSVTITAGQNTADISVAVLNEALVEGTETVTLTMSSITSGDTDITLLAPLSASADITDNDTATATIAKTTDGNEAGPVSAVFTVSLSAASSTATTLNYSVGGTATSGSDFTAPSGSVTVPANSTSATVTVTVTNDALVEATETLSLTLTGISGDPDISLGSTLLATADISDNDTATVSIANLANGAEPASNGSFRVTQSAVSSTDTVVNYAITGTAGSTDFTALSGSVTITAGQTTADISVPVIDELLVEATETVIATLNGFGAHDADITLSTTVAATVDITDNDTATVTLAKITDGIELAVPTNALFRVTQTAAASVDSVISYTVGGTATSGTDFTALTGSVTILAGNTTADISVAVLNENVVEATETVSLTLTGFTARDPEVTLGTTLTDSADITDSDTATVTLAAVSADKDEGTGGTTTAFTFSATLSNPVQGGFSIAYTTNDGTSLAGSDYTDNDSSLSFTGAAEAQTITVLVTHDGTNEIDEAFTVALGAITGTTLGGSLSVINSPQTGTIRNDDALTVTIAATDADADENTAGTGTYRITRNGVLGATTVQLAIDASSSAVAADWTQSGATFASLAPSSAGTAIIPDGSTFVDITLTPSADLHAEAAETVRLNITADAAYVIGSPADATVTIGQNDFLVINTNDAGEGTLRQAVLNANALAGDDTITFDATAFATAQTITLTSGQIVISSNVIVEGTGLLTLNGNATSRIFNISGATVILSDLTLTNGSTTSWGGALNIVNASFVTVQRCTVSNSTSALEGGGIYVNNGTLNVVSSTISGNTATTVGGGAIATGTSIASATVNLVNSTISGNTGANGGAMLFGSNAVVSIAQTTVTNNTSAQGPNVWSGGGAVTVANSIIAANQINTGHDDVGGAFTSSGGNLIGLGGAATGFTHGTNNDQFGTGAPINPLLGPLQDNGGPTLTHMLLNGSPAINNGLIANLPADTNDQRGAPNLRQRGPAPDSGAVEAFAFEPTLTVATTDEDVKTTSGLVITANSADGDLTTHYQITSILNGTLYKTDGSTVIAGNSFITKAEGLAGLKFLPDTNKNDPNTAAGFGFTAQAAISAAEADLRGETVDVEITVNPVADTPSVTGTFTVTSTQSTDGLVITRNAADSTEVTHFKITNIQNGTLYKNDGTTTIASNSFITVAEGGAGLKFTPTGGFVGSTSFTVQGGVDNAGTGLSPSASAEINVGYPAPRITVLGPLVLNRKNGLYEHTVRITNAYVVPMDGFRLTNTNLLPEVQMWNRTHAYLPVIENSVDLGAFSSRDVLVQYYSRERDIIDWEPTYSTDNLTDPEIAVLPPDLSGLWHGLASRSTQPIFTLNPAVGARLEVNVSTFGVLSGKVTEGKTVKPFTARISGYLNLGNVFGGVLETLVNQSNMTVPIPGGDVTALLAPYALTVIKGKTPAQDVYLAVIFIPEVNLMLGIMGGPEVQDVVDGLLGGLDGGNTRQGNVAELDDAGDEVETLLNLPFSIFLGWRNIWGMSIEGDRRAGPVSPVATYQPTPYLARHHFAMAPTEVPDIGGISTLNTVQALSAPEGFSFGTLVPLNVAKKRGDYTVAGRLADGTSFTCSSFYGQYGQCLVHQSLYGDRGSLLGLLLIIPGEEIADNDILGILTWLKPGPLGTAKLGRNYGRGFSLFMEAQGGTYTPPAKGKIVMGLSPTLKGVPNTLMSFEGAGLTSSMDQPMRAASSGLASLVNTLIPTLPNANAIRITSFSAATGLIKGSLTTAIVPKRAATFEALIVPIANAELPDLEENDIIQAPLREQTGFGYFLLPQVPVAPQTMATSPILSGQVILTPNVR